MSGTDHAADRTEPEEPSGGEPACLLALVCAECGAIAEQAPPTTCRRCGALVERD
ncbi:hypothetical protein [Streptomyces tateyamensis]|uniref:hypothetical protein n=1 Tax=Streptomyces tateyamensis TaxID=565073 RepID=UPI0015E8E2F5|nr:hypothetical protein [Streptomyces tateyamensis]